MALVMVSAIATLSYCAAKNFGTNFLQSVDRWGAWANRVSDPWGGDCGRDSRLPFAPTPVAVTHPADPHLGFNGISWLCLFCWRRTFLGTTSVWMEYSSIS